MQDTLLPIRLMHKLCIHHAVFQMAAATYCPVIDIMTRGQQVRVFSQILKKAEAQGYMVPWFSYRNKPRSGGYVGAHVMDAKAGAYFNE